MSFNYPVPRRDEKICEEIHGRKVIDPYRWMEDPDAQETKEFVNAQNAISQPYINDWKDKDKITEKLTKLWNYPKTGVPHKEGNKYFFSKNSGLQNQSVIYCQDALDGEPVVFFDPNSLSDDGTISLKVNSFSKDGSIWAYGLSQSGSDWFDIHFKNVETGENYKEVLTKAKFCGLTWTHDNQGIFYGCYLDHKSATSSSNGHTSGRDTTKHEGQKLLYHKIGTPQSEDIVVVDFPDHPKWRIHVDVSDCGKYLVVCPQEDCRDNLVYFAELHKMSKEIGITGRLELKQVIYQFKHDYEYITNSGSNLIFRTNCNAPNYQLVAIDIENQPSDHQTRADAWPMRTLIHEHDKNVLEWAKCVDENKLILCYMEDVKNVMAVHDLETGNLVNNIPLNIGSIVGLSGEKDQHEVFYKFSSMIAPGIIYYLNMKSSPLIPKVYKEAEMSGFDQSLYQVEQVFYQSKDKTEVPMFIASRKDSKRDGTSPCLLYGYGGFNISLTPYFSVTQLFFIHHFGYLAIPNIRGGGEYGEKWHNGGRLLKKQNGFNDFQAAAEFLIREKYTCKSKLAIKGGSNGGLLVGACVNQRPDLFGAGIAAVGVMDMLRFHKFTIGYAWCSDFGNPDEKQHFENIINFSPLHNVREPTSGQYPAILLTTADHDDRVVPSHTLKFIAQLQHELGQVTAQTNPLMARIDTKAGHGAGKPTSKLIEEVAEVFCFLAKSLQYVFIE